MKGFEFETLYLPYDHLKGWWDGDIGIVYCSQRNTLVHIDIITIMALMGEENDDPIVRDNIEVLINPEIPLPEVTIPIPEVSNLNFDDSITDSSLPLNKLIHTSSLIINFSSNINSDSFDELVTLIVGLKSEEKTTQAGLYLNVELIETDGLYSFMVNGEIFATHIEFSFTAPILMDIVMVSYYRSLGVPYAFHGAGMQWNNANCFFIAQSGKGKSTLSSYLLSKGAALFSDETIALDSQFEPTRIQMPITLKTGSWDSASHLNTQGSVWERFDDRKLKYFSPDWKEVKEGLPSVLVFPNYNSEGHDQILPIGPCRALKNMALSGYELPKGESCDAVEKILGWLEKIDVFEMTHSSSESAEKMLLSEINAL